MGIRTKTRFSNSRRLVFLLLIAFTAISCGRPDDAAADRRVTVFAAASLVPALDGIVADFEARNDIDVTVSYAASATLAQQIIAGADAGVFISASLEWADEVAQSVDVVRREDALGNGLVLVAPKSNRAEISTPYDLVTDSVERIAIGEPESVPAGQYAREALVALELWDALQQKLVYTMDVRQALLYAERAEVDAAIVYSTDAADSEGVVTVARLDDALERSVRYAIVLVQPDRDTAAVFFSYLLSAEAATRFEAAGFDRLPDSSNVSE